MKRNLIALAMLLTIFSCSNDRKESNAQNESSQNVDAALAETAASVKIIKTADMNFRVKDVQHTKEILGKQIKDVGGQLVDFEIHSAVQNTEKLRQSTDSLKEISAYKTEGTLTAKIPAEKLDDFTNSIAHLAVFVNSQSLKLDDKSLNYLANKLKTQNNAKATARIESLGKKQLEGTKSYLLITDNSIKHKIENM